MAASIDLGESCDCSAASRRVRRHGISLTGASAEAAAYGRTRTMSANDQLNDLLVMSLWADAKRLAGALPVRA